MTNTAMLEDTHHAKFRARRLIVFSFCLLGLFGGYAVFFKSTSKGLVRSNEISALYKLVEDMDDGSLSHREKESRLKSYRKVIRMLEDGFEHSIDCPSTNFAFCGHASCYPLDHQTSLCGCEKKENAAGTFQINSASGLLIKSRSYRLAVHHAYAGQYEDAAKVICGSLENNTLFTEAGYNASHGSYHYGYMRRLDESDENLTATTIVPHAETYGSCMGAPCIDRTWGKTDCSSTCVCGTWLKSVDDDDDDAKCIFNGDAVTTGALWGDTDDLVDWIRDVKKYVSDENEYHLHAVKECGTCTIEGR